MTTLHKPIRFFLDTEFIEDGHTIELISLALVNEEDEFIYLINKQCDLSRANDWVKENVIPQLRVMPHPLHRRAPAYDELFGSPTAIRDAVIRFVRRHPEPYSFWGYYSDYDWVVFCQLFGKMIDLPKGFPMYCHDLKQEMDRLGVDKNVVPQLEPQHNALADARWVRDMWLHLRDMEVRNG